MADVQPFRAVRYSGAAGALADLVAPPYDIVSAEERDHLQERSPYNVLHLTLPESAEDAGRRYREWLSTGVLVRDDEPATWFLAEEHRGQERHGVIVSLPAEPYSTGAVLPHEHTYPRVRDERRELLRATGVQLEPIFLLVDGPLEVDVPRREPDLLADGARLWRLPAADASPLAGAGAFLIADGHHRYESALDFGAGTRVMALVVSAGDPGLEILPTHRVFRDRPDLAELGEGDEYPDLHAAEAALADEPLSHASAIAYRSGRVELIRGDEGELDAELVARFGLDGIDYTPRVEQAAELVDRGEADAAFILRPPRVEDVFSAARQGKRMPPKSTYFFPKPLSGLLFHPVHP
jgi:uncharacterized protein (DUF1015 family)